MYHCSQMTSGYTGNELSRPCWTVCWGLQTYFTTLKHQNTAFEDQFGGVYTKELAESKVGRGNEAEYLRSRPAPAECNLISCIILLPSPHQRDRPM